MIFKKYRPKGFVLACDLLWWLSASLCVRLVEHPSTESTTLNQQPTVRPPLPKAGVPSCWLPHMSPHQEPRGDPQHDLICSGVSQEV